jgi:hypothetical protein
MLLNLKAQNIQNSFLYEMSSHRLNIKKEFQLIFKGNLDKMRTELSSLWTLYSKTPILDRPAQFWARISVHVVTLYESWR